MNNFSNRTLDYDGLKLSLSDEIKSCLSGKLIDYSEYKFVKPRFEDSFYWDGELLSIEKFYLRVEEYLLSESITRDRQIFDTFNYLLHYSGSYDITSYCEKLRSFNGLIEDAINLAKNFKKLKETHKISVHGDANKNEIIPRKISDKSFILDVNEPVIATNGIEITDWNYKNFQQLQKDKSLKKVILERSKYFSIYLYQSIGEANRNRQIVYHLLKCRGYKYSDRTISFDRIAGKVKKENYLTHEDFCVALLQEMDLPTY